MWLVILEDLNMPEAAPELKGSGFPGADLAGAEIGSGATRSPNAEMFPSYENIPDDGTLTPEQLTE